MRYRSVKIGQIGTLIKYDRKLEVIVKGSSCKSSEVIISLIININSTQIV